MWNPYQDGTGATAGYGAFIVNPTTNQQTRVSSGLGALSARAYPLSTTTVLASGQFAFVDASQNVLNAGDLYRFDSDDNSTTAIPSGFGLDIPTGGGVDATLGFAIAANQATTGWANFGQGAIALGSIDPELFTAPFYTNKGRLVIGAAFAPLNLDFPLEARTFKWRECETGGGDTPRLLDWKVTYRTDKSPSWGFDVEVADMCMTSVTNSSDISTSTPEISTSNNTSDATMSVNTADLGVELELDSNVVSLNDRFIYGEAFITNEGPGAARDVYFWMEPPDGCYFYDAWLSTNLYYDYFDYYDDYIEVYVLRRAVQGR